MVLVASIERLGDVVEDLLGCSGLCVGYPPAPLGGRDAGAAAQLARLGLVPNIARLVLPELLVLPKLVLLEFVLGHPPHKLRLSQEDL